MNNMRNALMGIVITVGVFCIGCEKKKIETEQVVVPETTKTIDYTYNVSAFKRNVTWSADNEAWQPVSVGLGIAKGGHVETGEASAATLNGTLGDIVMLGERAKVELLIEKLEKQSNGSSLAMRGVSLLKGSVRFTIVKNIGTFIVQTPSTIVKVKGTDFVVTYDEKSGATDVRVREGAVDVDDKKSSQKTYSLYKGQALLGVGAVQPILRPMTNTDQAMFEKFDIPVQTDTIVMRGMQSPSVPKETPEEIRSRLNAESNAASGTETNAKRINAQSALDNERITSQQKIDSMKIDYQANAKAEKDTFAYRKAVAQAVVDSTKSEAQSALDAERARFNAAAGSLKSQSSTKSDDAFDELKRRKAGR